MSYDFCVDAIKLEHPTAISRLANPLAALATESLQIVTELPDRRHCRCYITVTLPRTGLP